MSWLELAARIAERDVDVELGLDEGEVLAVVGPNGAGKSTLLQVLAGTLDADSGHLRLGGHDRWRTPTHRRRIATLTQQAMLFPHLSLVDNVAFAPRCAGRSRAGARRIATEHLELVGLADLAARRPAEVSGGQAQRAAIARALAAEPELLLLDEPFAALDADVTPALRQLLARLLTERRRAAVVVTHDLLDALALADRVLVLEGGRVAESGPVRQVLTRPRSRFGARFAGIDLVEGELRDGALRVGGTDVAGLLAEPAEGSGVALFRPAAVAIHPQPPQGSPRNTWQVDITGLEAHAQGVRVRGRHADLGEIAADVTAAAAAELGLAETQQVWFAVKAQEVELYAR